MAIKKNETSDKSESTLAVSLGNEFREVLKQHAAKEGKAEAHIARLALQAYLTSAGYKVPEVVEAKKGPKAGANVNPLAAKFGLTNAEFNRRVIHFLSHGGDAKKVATQDWSAYPMPAPKARAKADSITEQA